MNFSIAGIIARLFAPRHEISCSWCLWQRLCARLRERGRSASRETARRTTITCTFASTVPRRTAATDASTSGRSVPAEISDQGDIRPSASFTFTMFGPSPAPS